MDHTHSEDTHICSDCLLTSNHFIQLVCLPLLLHVCMPVCLIAHLFSCLSVCLSVCLFMMLWLFEHYVIAVPTLTSLCTLIINN